MIFLELGHISGQFLAGLASPFEKKNLFVSALNPAGFCRGSLFLVIKSSSFGLYLEFKTHFSFLGLTEQLEGEKGEEILHLALQFLASILSSNRLNSEVLRTKC